MNLEPHSDLQKMWRFCQKRGDVMVQDYHELEYVYNLMRDCKPDSYLEIGTAEGDTLLMLGSTLPETGRIHWIDKDEPQFREKRQQVTEMLKPRTITAYSGLSTDHLDIWKSVIIGPYLPFDVVMIDGGHEYETVLSDSQRFAPLANRYVFWHDIQMPSVKKAVDEYMDGKKYETFICSDNMGYGILKIA